MQRRWVRCWSLAGWLGWLGLAADVWAAEPPPVVGRVLTNITQIWQVPEGEETKSYPLRTEVVVYFHDPEWGTAAGECNGTPVWLPLLGSPLALKTGQRVLIEGSVVPAWERFLWDRTQVRVLEEGVALHAQVIDDPLRDPETLRNHLVSMEALVDGEVLDPTHFKIKLLSHNTPAMALVMRGEGGGSNAPCRLGDLVRVKGVFVPQLDRKGNLSDLALMVARPEDVEVIGNLAQDARFDLPVTLSESITVERPPNQWVRVQGTVREHEVGEWVTLWDSTGAVMVESKQSQPLRFGDQIEAIGYPYAVGVEHCLRRGLYRRINSTNALDRPAAAAVPEVLRLAGQIRELTPQAANDALPVRLLAVVTWSHPQGEFAYVQDSSGGIRVMNPRWETTNNPVPGAVVSVEGVTSDGAFVPVVTNAVLRNSGWWNMEPGRLVSLEQALTGLEDGRWVEMRGYARAVTRTHGLVRIDLSTSSGEFAAWTADSEPFEQLRGTILRVQGVCSAVPNARRQLVGVRVFVADSRYVRVEEPVPEDVFAAPRRPLGDLRRFSSQNALSQRVRTDGLVVLHVPGSLLYVQEGSDGVCALSQQTNVLRPGDRVEVVGFPGHEGRRMLLREAVYRSLGKEADPAPVRLLDVRGVDLDKEGLLARAEGRLLDVVDKEGEVRLLVQTEERVFEAKLDRPVRGVAGERRLLARGSRIAVTGVYEVSSDGDGSPRSFLIRLRSWNDVNVLEAAPWWTPARLLGGLLGVMFASVVALVWGILISRKNALLQQAQAELRQAHDRLELRVQERTRDLASSLSLLNATLESAAEGILVVDQEGVVRSHNSKFVSMWRLSEELVAARDDQALLAAVVSQLKDGYAFTRKVKELYATPDAESFDLLEFKDGRVFERFSQPQRLGGRCVGRVWCFRDVTDRQRAEAEREVLGAQNRQLHKSESLGRMAGAIAHHFNNRLQAVTMSLELARNELPPGAAATVLLAEALDSARKASEVSGLMLTYLGQTNARREPLDLSATCAHGLSLVRAALPQTVGLEVQLPSPGPTVLANANQIHQILTNLVHNAWEAGGGARVSIRLAVTTAPLPDIPTHHRFPVEQRLSDPAYGCLEVADTGCGIRSADFERIFDPFFSTKAAGRGMGLPVVLGLVRAHSGLITVESQPGQGSVFRVYVPLSAEPIPPRPTLPVRPLAAVGGGTVLLVEDEAAVRKAVALALKRMGCVVLEAADGAEGVEVFRARQSEIDCVLCDLTMPRLNGWETLEALRKLAPGIPVILASGYSEAQVMEGNHLELPQALLTKPYEFEALQHAITRVLRDAVRRSPEDPSARNP